MRTDGPIYGERGLVNYVGDGILCAFCGQVFKALNRHLPAAHGFTNREYKIALSIPLGEALMAPSLRQHLSSISIFNDPSKNIGLATASSMGLDPRTCAKRGADVMMERLTDPTYKALLGHRKRKIRTCEECAAQFFSPHFRKTCSDTCERVLQRKSHLGKIPWNAKEHAS